MFILQQCTKDFQGPHHRRNVISTQIHILFAQSLIYICYILYHYYPCLDKIYHIFYDKHMQVL